MNLSKKLPEGYDTNVGSVGDKLSGGEKQRVTIARMILKDAPIIVLDEATAYVDPDSEQKIQEALNVLTQDKTLIVIAHRLSTIQHADQIIVLGNQQILEKGSHQLLLKLEAHYKICGICICIQKTEVSIPKVIKLMSKGG